MRFTFAFLVIITVGISSSAVGLKSCARTTAIKKFKSIIKKKRKKHDEVVFLTKIKLNTKEVLISRVLTDSYISHNEIIWVNNVFRKYGDIKQGI